MTEKQFYNFLLIVMFVLALIVFMILLKVTAPYGRYTRPGWGPRISAKLGWIIQESPSVILFAFFFFLGDGATKIIPILFLIMWEIHYINRTFVYPFRIRGSGKKVTLTTMILALIFTSINSYLNGRWLTYFSLGYSFDWIKDPRFIIGVLFFLIGFGVNLHSDRILRKLRNSSESGYKIPYGGIFKFVSCGNYFGEIIEWLGWAVATWSLPGLCFAIWTAANLVPRAVSHHRWYKSQFPDYPRERRTVIPFVL